MDYEKIWKRLRESTKTNIEQAEADPNYYAHMDPVDILHSLDAYMDLLEAGKIPMDPAAGTE